MFNTCCDLRKARAAACARCFALGIAYLTALRPQTFERVVPYYPKERVKRQDVVVRAARAMCSHGFRS